MRKIICLEPYIQRASAPCRAYALGSPSSSRQPSVTESVALPPDPGMRHMSSNCPALLDGHAHYTVEQLLELRRQMLRYARSTPPGAERNRRRQIADLLRRLFKNKEWLDAHLVDGSAIEYRVNTVAADGSSHKAIEIDCPDDAAAVEYAKQYIDGKDIELWQSNRKVAEFEHKPE